MGRRILGRLGSIARHAVYLNSMGYCCGAAGWDIPMDCHALQHPRHFPKNLGGSGSTGNAHGVAGWLMPMGCQRALFGRGMIARDMRLSFVLWCARLALGSIVGFKTHHLILPFQI